MGIKWVHTEFIREFIPQFIRQLPLATNSPIVTSPVRDLRNFDPEFMIFYTWIMGNWRL